MSKKNIYNRKYLDYFERTTSLPARATKDELKGIGARYFQREVFIHPLTKEMSVMEFLVLPYDGRNYLWKRIRNLNSDYEEKFEIHKSFIEREKFSLESAVDYVASSPDFKGIYV